MNEDAENAQDSLGQSGVYRGTIDAQSELLSSHDWIEELRFRVSRMPDAFADDPRGTLEQAHDFMAQVVAHQETSGNDADAEELAAALAHYRDFLNRLTSVTSEPT
jgi:hypothetical protein